MIEAQSLHQIIKFRGLASIENVAFFSEQQSAMGRFGLAKCMHDARGMKGFEVTLAAAKLKLVLFRMSDVLMRKM
jgi:hypothetical protein